MLENLPKDSCLKQLETVSKNQTSRSRWFAETGVKFRGTKNAETCKKSIKAV